MGKNLPELLILSGIVVSLHNLLDARFFIPLRDDLYHHEVSTILLISIGGAIIALGILAMKRRKQ